MIFLCEGDTDLASSASRQYPFAMRELVFEVHQEADGGYWARSVGEGIVTQGDSWEELCEMVVDATKGYFFDSPRPDQLRLVLNREEVLPLENAA